MNKAYIAAVWQHNKFDTINRWYREGKISFAKKLSFQMAVTDAMYKKM